MPTSWPAWRRRRSGLDDQPRLAGAGVTTQADHAQLAAVGERKHLAHSPQLVAPAHELAHALVGRQLAHDDCAGRRSGAETARSVRAAAWPPRARPSVPWSGERASQRADSSRSAVERAVVARVALGVDQQPPAVHQGTHSRRRAGVRARAPGRQRRALVGRVQCAQRTARRRLGVAAIGFAEPEHGEHCLAALRARIGLATVASRERPRPPRRPNPSTDSTLTSRHSERGGIPEMRRGDARTACACGTSTGVIAPVNVLPVPSCWAKISSIPLSGPIWCEVRVSSA